MLFISNTAKQTLKSDSSFQTIKNIGLGMTKV